LESLFDFDIYLRWLAFNTLMRNGDYIDETFFYASLEHTGDGEVLYYRNIGWDYDDLNSGCHYGAVDALVDPHRIAYCAEDEIDLSMLRSVAIYDRFIDHLVDMLDVTITEEILAAELATIREELFAVLDNDAACAAMVEVRHPSSTGPPCEEVHAAISTRITRFQTAMNGRWAALRGLIEAYRPGP